LPSGGDVAAEGCGGDGVAAAFFTLSANEGRCEGDEAATAAAGKSEGAALKLAPSGDATAAYERNFFSGLCRTSDSTISSEG
jgi:hypothetical protein